MTYRQIQWAASHDWFVRDNGNGTITVHDQWVWRDGTCGDAWVFFSDFRELRAWAGY